MKMWHTAARALFGDESISLRHVRKLQEIMQNTSALPNTSLASFFSSKMPSLGSYMCAQFVDCILQFYNAHVVLPPETQFKSPVQLLVHTALLTEDRRFASFPEFVRSLKGGVKVHPILRIAAWVKRVHLEILQDKAMPHLECLMKLKVIDQIGFPLVLDIGFNSSSLQFCDAFAQKGNYSNLRWMHETLTHGYAINWNDVRTFWKSHFITSSSLFEELLSVCPNPGACLQAVDPKNLSVLVENGSHRLAKIVIEFYEVDHNRLLHELNQSDSPFYSAAWFLFRQQEYPFSLEPLRKLGVDEVKVLMWASRFGFHALSVPDRHRERTAFLQSTLIQCTIELLLKMDELKKGSAQNNRIDNLETQIVVLWSHVFSGLLKVGTKHGGVPHEITLMLAAHQYPPNSKWPLLVKYLSAVLHGRADKAQVDSLLETDFFVRLKERAQYEHSHDFMFPPGKLGIRFVIGLMTIGPPGALLSRNWQLRVLTTKDVVIPDQFCNPKGLQQLEQGLTTLRDPSNILIATGKVRTALESHRVFSKNNIASVTSEEYKQTISMADRSLLKHKMRFLKNITNHPEILDYYNIYVGSDWKTVESQLSDTEKFKMDKYNNPIGDKFDLGKKGAFTKFRILIGNFFQRGEFNPDLFKKYAQTALETKGFFVNVVYNEEQFMKELQNYDLAWLISSDALDWNERSGTMGVEKWRRLADACQQFYASGKGLFIFADNEPFRDHASAVLERLFQVSLTGNTPAKKELKLSDRQKPVQGTFDGSHLIGSGLTTLFEGDTVSYPIEDIEAKGLRVFAQSTDNHPVIFCGENKAGGRVVVDTGFTKLWLEWESAGVTPQVEPREVKSGKAEIVLVIDGSGSVGDDDFRKMKKFSKTLAEKLVKPNTIKFGAVQFAHYSRIECYMDTYDLPTIHNRLDAMIFQNGGTDFDAGLRAAETLFNFRDTRSSKIIIFQTDGQGHTQHAANLHAMGITVSISELDLM